mgnify:CR=1 FL=1
MRQKFIYPMKILIIMLMTFILPCQAGEITISSIAPLRTGHKIGYDELDKYYATNYTLKWQRISGGASSCVNNAFGMFYWSNNNVTASSSMNEGTWYNLYNDTSRDFSERPDAEISADNSCAEDVVIEMAVGHYNGGNPQTTASEHFTLPAGTSCSLDVEQDIDFSKVNKGDSVNAVNISANPSGVGVVAFRPNAVDGDKGKITNGDNFLTYSISGAFWNNALAQWEGALSGGYSLKLDDIPQSAAPGKYNGNVTATISCE